MFIKNTSEWYIVQHIKPSGKGNTAPDNIWYTLERENKWFFGLFTCIEVYTKDGRVLNYKYEDAEYEMVALNNSNLPTISKRI